MADDASTIGRVAAEDGRGGSAGAARWVRSGAVGDGGDGECARGLGRTGSIYTLGRASFTGQLAALTAMRLPDADCLAKRISALPTAAEAAAALADASAQIRVWIAKAADVLDGLTADDDVEWAAAGGTDGVAEVDGAIRRFEQLVDVYILAIETLQTRPDVARLGAAEITAGVERMESIVSSWEAIKATLNRVKLQVEIAMEWQRLWDDVLGDIAREMEGLHRSVFEMEEARHNGSESVLSNKDSIDISELETIVEEHPGRNRMQQNRMTIAGRYANGTMTPPPPPPPPPHDQEDASLLALFARMQPLRASLDFLPMRLSTFHIKGNSVFPSACVDLDQRRDQLEAQWTKLEADANSLRSELGEDRWVAVFRNAGRQALKMEESITRSFQKLKAGLHINEQETNPHAVQNKIVNYEQKKRHYGPAIERVLAIIDRGVTDRLTANGEILRLQSEIKRRWTAVQAEMHDVDAMLEDVKEDIANAEARDKNLRDSCSTVISSERSIASSLGADTPASSPASSVIAGHTSHRGSFESRTPTPVTHIKLRSASAKTSDTASLTPSSIPRRTLFAKRSLTDMHSSPRSPASMPSSTSSKQPAWPSRPDVTPTNKPRFRSAVKSGPNDFKPLSTYEPSPYAKTSVTPKHNYLRSGLGQSAAAGPRVSPAPGSMTRISSAPAPRSSSLPRPSSSMAAFRKSSIPVPHLPSPPSRWLSPPASAPASHLTRCSGRRSSLMTTADTHADRHPTAHPPTTIPPTKPRRPSPPAPHAAAGADTNP